MDNAKEPTHAKVKFVEDGSKKIIPINDIIEFQDNPPKDFNAFDKYKVYTCLYKDDKYPDLTKYGIQIGSLCDQAEAEEDRKRPTFPQLSLSTVDNYYNEEEYSVKSVEEEQCKDKKKKIKDACKIVSKRLEENIVKQKMNILMSTQKLDLKVNKCTSAPEESNKLDEKIENATGKESIINSEKKENDVDELNNLKLENSRLKNENDNLRSKFKDLQEKYQKQNQRIESLMCFNQKLQAMLFVKEPVKSAKDSPESSFTLQVETSNLPSSPSPTNAEAPLHCSTPKLSDKYKSHLEDVSIEADTKVCYKRIQNFENEEDASFLEQPNLSNDEIKYNRIQKNKRRLDSDEDIESKTEKDYSLMSKENDTNLKKKRKTDKNNDEDVDSQSEDDDLLKSKKKRHDTKRQKKISLVDESTMGKKFLEKFENDKRIKMVYIKHDICIPYDEWKSILNSRSASIFTKALLRFVYKGDELIKRCLKPGQKITTPNGVNKRVAISPKKSDAIELCLEYYLRKRVKLVDKNEIATNLKKKTHYFTEEINKAIQEAKKRT